MGPVWERIEAIVELFEPVLGGFGMALRHLGDMFVDLEGIFEPIPDSWHISDDYQFVLEADC